MRTLHENHPLKRADRRSARFSGSLPGTGAALLIVWVFIGAVASGQPETTDSVRFAWIDIYIDTAEQPLAAYQFEATARTTGAAIVGVEGGEHHAFSDAPYYDPKALMNDRIIVAAFSTASDLPTGRTRLARLHLRLTGPATAEHALVLHTAASSEGNRIPATITMGQGETP